jgi:hypothetical protein
MAKSKKNRSQQDLAYSSATLRDERASAKQRGIAGQNLANHRWLKEKERELAKARAGSRPRRQNG